MSDMMRVRDPETFAAAREAAGLGVRPLARKINRSAGHTHDIGTGRRRIGRADADLIAGLLGVPVVVLFADAPDTVDLGRFNRPTVRAS